MWHWVLQYPVVGINRKNNNKKSQQLLARITSTEIFVSVCLKFVKLVAQDGLLIDESIFRVKRKYNPRRLLHASNDPHGTNK